jgi:hypothetical protein
MVVKCGLSVVAGSVRSKERPRLNPRASSEVQGQENRDPLVTSVSMPQR